MERAPGTARHPDHETSYPNGDDLRRDPLEVRKATLASIVVKASSGIRFKRPDGLRPCLQDGAGGHRVETHGLTLPLRALAGLVEEDEKPGVCGGDARGGGRLEDANRMPSPAGVAHPPHAWRGPLGFRRHEVGQLQWMAREPSREHVKRGPSTR